MEPLPDCRSLEPELDWQFHAAGLSLLGLDHAAVCPLTDEAGERFWASHVGDPATVYCRRTLPPGHRLLGHTAVGPNWYTFANDLGLPDGVAAFLRRELPWPEDQVMHFAHAPRRVYRVPWAAFLRHWRRFVRQDDSFVFALGRPEFAFFVDGGWLYLGGQGNRAEPPAAADGPRDTRC
jgi:hypothetical protein